MFYGKTVGTVPSPTLQGPKSLSWAVISVPNLHKLEH